MSLIKILIVDDSPVMHDIVEDALLPFFVNCQLNVAGNGIEAIKILEQWVPDLILTDWDMPEMNGPELIKHIRQKELFQDIPIMMITGLMVNDGSLKEAFDLGASDFLRKPFNKTELIARVKSLLLLSKSVRELKEQNLVISEHSRFILSMLNSVPLPMVYYSLEGLILNCNTTFLDLFGLSINDAIGQNIYKISGIHALIKNDDHDMTTQGKPKVELETNMELPKGRYHFMITNNVFFNYQEQPEGIISILSDITALKTTHQQSLEQKKRELVSSAMKLIQMNQLNEKLIGDLEELNQHTDTDGKALIKNLLSKYNLNTIDNTWKEFETRFGKVYEDFYHSLAVVHPDLTPTEKKICALLRLNLTSKEIAAITFQDAKSVDMARYRLRKKLNLGADNNLVDYLMKI